VGMHGLGDQVAGFDEGGGAVGGASGQQDFAVIENFLGQSPVAHHDVEFGESDAQQFAQVAAGKTIRPAVLNQRRPTQGFSVQLPPGF